MVYASEDEELTLRLYADKRVPMGGKLVTHGATVQLDVWLADADNLWHSTDSGVTWTKLTAMATVGEEFTNVHGAIKAALAHDGPALVEGTVDASEPLLPAKRIEKYAQNLEKALDAGTRDGPEIREALRREPSRTQLS